MSDLQNIVDRLDLLMGSSAEPSVETAHGLGGAAAREQIDQTLTDLTERVGALEREAEELRTLVNHLMTIATWQAKVTATLVGEEGGVDVDDQQQSQPPLQQHDEEAYEPTVPEHHFVDRVGHHVESRHVEEPLMNRRADEPQRARRPDEPLARSAAPTLDDDIDDILGTDREPPAEDGGPPPDFGI